MGYSAEKLAEIRKEFPDFTAGPPPEEPVHVTLTRVLKTIHREVILKMATVSDGNVAWDEVADEFVMALAGRVVTISVRDYDHLVTELRNTKKLLAESSRLCEELSRERDLTPIGPRRR